MHKANSFTFLITKCFVLTLFCCINFSFAQFQNLKDEWRWVHFTTENGLPSDFVEDIVETSDSTVWVSTKNGIAMYDGFQWISFDSAKGLPAKQPVMIAEGIKGQLMAVINRKLYIGNKFGFIDKSPTLDNTVQNIHSVCKVDSNTTLYCNSFGELILHKNDKSPNRIFNESPTRLLWFTRANNVWLYNENGFHLFKDEKLEQIISNGRIALLSENRKGDGVLSVLSPKHKIGIWEWTKSGKLFFSETERGRTIRTMDISSTGNVIAVYASGEIRVRQNGVWNFLVSMPSFISDILFVKFRDNDDLWIGTEHGLYLFRNSGTQWSRVQYPFTDKRNMVMEIFKSSNGEIWIGSLNGLEVRSENRTVRYIEQINGKKLNLITGINESIDGSIWISSGDSFQGTYRWNGRYWQHYGNKEGLKAPFIHKIRKDRNGNLLFLGLGETFEDSISDPGAFKFVNEKFIPINADSGLLSNRVYSFVEDSSKNLWFGTREGLSRFSDGIWKHFDVSQGMMYVYTIGLDHNQNLWFSNFNSNLGYITPDDSIHWVWNQNIGSRQQVWDIQTDEHGIVWIAGARGLFSYQDGFWSSYNIENGSTLRELRVVLPLRDKVYVGGHGSGIGVLDRQKINFPIKIDIQKPLIESDIVHLNWKVNAYWGATSSDNIETRYRFDGGNWSEWSSNRSLSNKDLSSGNHVFQVQCKDHYGTVRDNITNLTFFIPYPVYFQPRYFIPFLLLAIFLTFILKRYVQHKKYHKQMLYDQKARIASDLHDEIGSNLGTISLISQKLFRSKNLPKAVHDELILISQTSIETANYLRDIVWYTNPEYDSVNELIFRMKETSAVMLKGISIQYHFSGNTTENNTQLEIRRHIFLIFKEILHNIVKHSRATQVEISIGIDATIFTMVIKDNGIGFDIAQKNKGFGLMNLQLRAKEIGGVIVIHSSIGKGTEISLKVKNNANA